MLHAFRSLETNAYHFEFTPKQNADEEEIKARYGNVLGSAVNPVLREGNSDRRAAGPVKAFAQKNPKRLKPWTADSPAHVAHMSDNDFFSSEKSLIVGAETTANITFEAADGSVTHTVRGDIPIEEVGGSKSFSLSFLLLLCFFVWVGSRICDNFVVKCRGLHKFIQSRLPFVVRLSCSCGLLAER